jgi:hypothetical protein
MQLLKPPKPKATRKRLKKEILSDDFKKRKILWKNIAENFLEKFPYGKIFHLATLVPCNICGMLKNPASMEEILLRQNAAAISRQVSPASLPSVCQRGLMDESGMI